MAQRPEVLHISCETVQTKVTKARPVSQAQTHFHCSLAYELMLKEVLHYHRPCVSSIVCFHADPATKILPGKMFQMFDWVICKFLPASLWGSGGIVNCRLHAALPDVVATRSDVYFFAGFNAVLPRQLRPLPASPPAPPDFSSATEPAEASKSDVNLIELEDVVIVTAQPEEALKFKFEVFPHFDFTKKNV